MGAGCDSADVAVEVSRFDLIVLDLGLPTRDGLTVLRRLRERRDKTPVLIVGTRCPETARFGAGARAPTTYHHQTLRYSQ